MRSWILIVYLFVCSIGFGQSDSVIWKNLGILNIEPGSTWSMDALENYYVANANGIQKFDSTRVLKFKQSYKSLGNMTALVPINSMKLVHFSEEQQTLCYFDNTLAPTESCMELSDQGIINATLVCRSSQPNKLWILDQVNSTLVLISLDATGQRQEIKNLRGILNVESVSQIIERNNQLMLVDPTRGIYIFDLYGSLLEFIERSDVIGIDATENALFILQGNVLTIRSSVSLKEWETVLPINGVNSFVFIRNHFFFSNAEGVHKFAFQMSE